MRSTSREKSCRRSRLHSPAITILAAGTLLTVLLATGSRAAEGSAFGPPNTSSLVRLAQAKAPSAERPGDPVAGKAAFDRQCAICHTVDKGGDNRYGPNLFGVDGRQAGTAPGYAYTRAFKTEATWTWEDGSLAGWISAPGRMVPGTAMAVFPGVTDKDRDNIVAYLATLH